LKESYIKLKTTLENAKKTYIKTFGSNELKFEFSDEQKTLKICNSEIYIFKEDEYIIFNDFEGDGWFGLETTVWLELAENDELIYAHYDESMQTAEFVRILNGKCVREYTVYDGEIDLDNSDNCNEFEFGYWGDVASYVDKLGYGLGVK